MKTHLLPLIIGCFLFSSFDAKAQPGTLDLSFGDSGRVVTSVPEITIAGNAIAKQSDEKIVVTGNYYKSDRQGYAAYYTFLARYNQNGTLDSTFRNIGLLQPDTIFYNTQANCVLIQPDHKIVVAGSYSDYSSDDIDSSIVLFFLARFNEDGSLDSTFGIEGIVKTHLKYQWANIYSIARQTDGKILATGMTNNDLDQSAVALVRYTSNGSIDSSFGENGSVYNDFGGSTCYGRSVAIQSEGKILVAGNKYVSFIGFQMFVYQYLQNGQVDYTFGTNGVVFINFFDAPESVSELIVQPDGKIIVTGGAGNPVDTSSYIAISRLNSSGSFDSTFDVDGKVTTKFPYKEGGISSAALQADGKIIVGGSFQTRNGDIEIIRYYNDGQIDSSFGIDGIVISPTDVQVYYETLTDIVIQQDGKIVTSGTLKNDAEIYRFNNNEIILPVNITSFTATKKENSVLLNWKTCSEINSKGFYVERSTNNNNWTSLGYVASKGGGYICNNEYSFTDTKPINGNNFYRLKQVDNDSKFTYSKTVSANFIIANHIKISPNPVKDILMIEGLSGDKKSQLTIINASGKILKTVFVTGPTYSWNLLNLPSGLYYLTVEQQGKTVAKQKFVKEN